MRTLLVVVTVLSSVACRHAPRGAPPGVPGVPLEPRQTQASTLGGQVESVPYGVMPDVVLDEATIYVQPNEVCANVVLRQPVGFDLPLSQLDMRCSADGQHKQRVVPTIENPPTERDYPFQGPPPMVTIQGPHGTVSFPVGAAATSSYRVVERSFQLCCPFTASGVFRLTIDGMTPWEQYVRTDFVWRLRAP